MTQSYRANFRADTIISRRRALTVFSALTGWLACRAGEAPVGTPLGRENLLVYRDGAEARPIKRVSQWMRRRDEIIDAFNQIAGDLPAPKAPWPLDLKIEEQTDCGDYVRRRITYTSEPESRVPAYLLIPRSALRGQRAPAALCLHQTHRAGQKVVVGLGESPDDEYGVELVRRGYVCLAPPYPLLANYYPDLGRLGYQSGVMKAIWDNIRGLDLLDSLPFVKQGGRVAIGHSLGGHNAIFTSLFDRRIRAVAVSCAFDSFRDYMGGNITGWTQTRYFPRLRAYLGRPAEIPFDFHQLIGALAPRALFINAPLGDTNFKWRSVDGVVAAAREVYRLFKADDRLVLKHPDCGHRFPPELRLEAYEFLEQHRKDDL